ncbi:MAG TPA: DeoR/GlpR family DNA-binding transcription regulator [Bacteroidota bacterium]|nr:DeoR/GlpR family DNA-binding transcription regulator [Bacteroidota bacterium]
MKTRLERILAHLIGRENVSVSELSQLLGVSEVTIRSDLNRLSEQGKVERMHGGARLAVDRVRQEFTFQKRKSLNSSQKDKIGRAASALIQSHDAVLFDSSTTVLALAHALRDRTDLTNVTVVPTGVWTAIELMGVDTINVLLPGGYLRHTSGSITGFQAGDFMNDLLIKKAFLGAWGISSSIGVTDTHLVEIELKKFIVERVEEVIVLVDGSKFGQTGLSVYADMSKISTVITDDTAPAGEIEKLRAHGITVIVAE